MSTLSPKDRKRSRQKQRDDVPLSEDDYPWFVADNPKLLESLRVEKKRAKRDNPPPPRQTNKKVKEEKPHAIDMKSRTEHITSHIMGIGALLLGCGISGIIFSILLHSEAFIILSVFCIIGGFGFYVAGNKQGIKVTQLVGIIFLAIFMTCWILVFTQLTGITDIPWIDRSPHGWGGP